MVMKLAFNGPYKLRTERDIVYEQGLAQYVTQAFIWLPGHRTQCFKDDEVIGFISNHLPSGV